MGEVKQRDKIVYIIGDTTLDNQTLTHGMYRQGEKDRREQDQIEQAPQQPGINKTETEAPDQPCRVGQRQQSGDL